MDNGDESACPEPRAGRRTEGPPSSSDERRSPPGQLLSITATLTGLAAEPVNAAADVRVLTKKGVLLIEGGIRPRSQGQCPGSPMCVGANSEASGGAMVLMFWGGAWMEYDVPFDRPGEYRLGVRAAGRATGHPDEKPAPLKLTLDLDRQSVGALVYPADGKMITRYLDFQVAASGRRVLRVAFPVDAGDIFVDYLTLEAKNGAGN